MKKLLIIPALMVALAGCSPAAQQNLVTIVNDVQIATETACKFVPTAATIADIISAGSATIPAQIAQTICQAVAGNAVKVSKLTAPMSVVVNGKSISLDGYFVK